MGRRGPAPLPLAERIARGEERPARINYSEPIPSGEVIMPDDMEDAAEAVWKRVMEDAPPGMLTGLDSDIMRLYCEAVARYVTAQTIYRQAPLVQRGWFTVWDEKTEKEVRRPLWVKNPIHQVLRDNAEMVRLLARELGFTPSARVNLHITAAGGSGILPFDQTLGVSGRMRLIAGGTLD